MAKRRPQKPKTSAREAARSKPVPRCGLAAPKSARARKGAFPPDFDADAFIESIMPRPMPTHRFKPEDLPDPRQWHSELREFEARPLTKHDHAQVLTCLNAIGTVEATGMTVLARAELAAALMAAACTSAYNSAAAQGQPADGPERFSHSEDFIVRRAREIYAQGRA